MISAWENLHFAMLELVRSTPIKQRLVCAYRRHLVSIPEDQLPGEVRDSFAQMMRSLCAVQPLRGEDAVAASVRKMSNQAADDCAALVVEIFGITCRALLNSARQSAAVVQLHNLERDSSDVREPDDTDVPALIASS
ncbi:MAG: hypothetical protein M3O41_18510 [Pseudomonadota bacterium]|nr:hypothetical protein [Pseudomonadota bacterium]